MPENKQIRDLMIPISDYPVVYDTDTLKDAVLVLKKHIQSGKQHRSLVVFSRDKKIESEKQLVGILTIRDIFNVIKKNAKIRKKHEYPYISWVYFYQTEPLHDYLLLEVKQAIRPLITAFVQADESITKATELMMTKSVNIVPVFEKKKAVGIIRAIDLLDYIGDLI
ncbi:MAG: histidine kinase [Peptococcaceae bacterium BRH_c4b]|nr:MAG: histidine kinase [Peptococcaceae bacterium BRH_c4b]